MPDFRRAAEIFGRLAAMKTLLTAALMFSAAAASACVDLSGTYKMVWDEGMVMTDTLEQTGCETIRVSSRLVMPDGTVVKTPALTFRMDGRRRLVMSSRTVPKIACPGECYASWIAHGDQHVVVWMMEPGYENPRELAVVVYEKDAAGNLRATKTITDPQTSFSYVSVGVGTRISVPPAPAPGPALRQLQGLAAPLKP